MIRLGLDYGAKHLGVALADGPLAAPLTTLSTSTALPVLTKLVDLQRVSEIVIGDCPPAFLADLRGLGLPVYQADETLTSHDARQALLHTTPTKRKNLEHAVSASLILQSYLDNHTQS